MEAVQAFILSMKGESQNRYICGKPKKKLKETKYSYYEIYVNNYKPSVQLRSAIFCQ